MRAVLLLLLIGCARAPSMEADPEVFWFRSRTPLPRQVANAIVREARGDSQWWAGPLVIFVFPNGFILGHRKLHLHEYEPAVGRFRAVASADDWAMSCSDARTTLRMLSSWAARFSVEWDARLGGAWGRVPGAFAKVEEAACANGTAVDPATIRQRYADRPR